jgi:sortase A
VNLSDPRARRLFWAALAVVLALALAPGLGVGGQWLTDKGWHFIAFATLAAFGARTRAMAPSWRTAAFWTLVAVGVEIAQGVMGLGRDASGVDACASLAGALFGLGIGRRAAASVRGLAVVTLAICAAGLLADAGYRSARRPVTEALLAQAWRAGRHGDSAAPWPGAPAPVLGMLRLEGARAPIAIVDGATRRALGLAPGLWARGRRPGERGVAIVLGHRNAAFRALGALRVGDAIRLDTIDGVRFDYRVARLDVVRWNDSHLHPDAPGEQLALVTCWPVTATAKSPWRLVVYAARTPAAA